MAIASPSVALDRAISAVLTVAVVAFTVVYLRQNLWSSPGAGARELRVTVEERWRDLKELAAIGQHRGNPRAPIHLIEFADFECPFCRRFDSVSRALESKYDGKIRRTFLHTPIPGHRFASQAARVAECAGEQHRFWPMHDALFALQDSLGTRPWILYARDAGIPSEAQFEQCAQRSDTVAAVAAGLRLALDFEVRGTPTIVLNGRRMDGAPTTGMLDSVIKQLLKEGRQ